MQLVVGNRIITTPIEIILKQVNLETHGIKYKQIKDCGDNLMVSCPRHKGGTENHPSCSVLNVETKDIPIGFHHCFTCGLDVPIETAIGIAFDKDTQFGKDWLKERFGDVWLEEKEILLPIEISAPKPKDKPKCVDESILSDYDYYHNYMWSRKLSKEVVDKFRVGYDPKREMITFPVWDEYGNLVMITGRSVRIKMFHIDKDVEKPVYLLNFMLQDKVKTVYVCESQINALYMNSLGYPSVALIGTGSSHQYSVLRKCGIRNYILMFDGDEAGRKGAERFKKSLGNECMITDIILPNGKDVNDLSEEEIKNLLSKRNVM